MLGWHFVDGAVAKIFAKPAMMRYIMVACVGVMLIMMLQMFGVTGPADSPMNKLIAGGMAMFFGFLIVSAFFV